MSFSVEIKNQEMFDNLLDKIKLYEREKKVSLRGAGEIVQAEAKKNHRFKPKTNILVRSINLRVKKDNCEVFIDKTLAPYGAAVHNGSRPHEIKAKNAKSLFWVNGGKGFYSKSVKHPGTKPDSFLFEALDNKTKEVVDHIQKGVSDAFGKFMK